MLERYTVFPPDFWQATHAVSTFFYEGTTQEDPGTHIVIGTRKAII